MEAQARGDEADGVAVVFVGGEEEGLSVVGGVVVVSLEEVG